MKFFSYLFKNFTKLITLNFLNLLVFVPYAFFMVAIKAELGIPVGFGYIFDIFSMLLYSLVGIAPLSLGTIGVSALLAKDEPAFPLVDFKDFIKKNLKQGIIMLAVNIIIFYFFTVGYKFYFSGNESPMVYLYVIILFLYLTLHIFAGYITITYKLSIPHIYKKALIFALLNLPQNILLLAGIAVIYALTFFISTLLGYIFSGFIVNSLVSLLITCYAYKTIEKYSS